MMYKNTLVAVSLSALALGSAIPVCEESVWDWFEVQLHEFLDNVPNGFSFDGTAESSTNLTLRIALAQSNFDGLVEALYNVSDPSSEYYGQYLSKEEVCRNLLAIATSHSLYLAGGQLRTTGF